MDFSILSYSRSVITKQGDIFLLGGEQSIGASNDVYKCNLETIT